MGKDTDLPVSPVKNYLILTGTCTDILCKFHLCFHPSIASFFIELLSDAEFPKNKKLRTQPAQLFMRENKSNI